MLSTMLVGTLSQAAEISIGSSVVRPTPRVTAYNLGHFYPGSNTADWWRYSGASGARIFLSPSHIKVSGSERPGDADVVDQATFLARRAALSADPLNTDFINWPIIIDRFDTVLSGNNKIIPSYALGQIHAMGGTTIAQMTLSEGSFPIADENDWTGKWVAWRTFYTAAFYLAREFDIERFISHNEPNHPNSYISPSAWLMRARLASDAVQVALADVNRLYGKSLQPRFSAPSTAGSTGSSISNYGKPIVQSIRTNFLGQSATDYRVCHQYTYQKYNLSSNEFVSDFLNLRSQVNAVTPSGVDLLPFGATEYNVFNGATYDTMIESSDTLSMAVTFGGITAGFASSGMDELYAFKFGMTLSSGNFPVQKNGMSFCDNSRAPYNYGTMGRGAEVYRLFCKGFAPGREILSHSVSGADAANIRTMVARDPATSFYYVFSVNESGVSVPMEIHLSSLEIPDGNHAIIEEVSAERSGTIRSIAPVVNGRILTTNQPAQSVWLVSIPSLPQTQVAGSSLVKIPVSKDVMVRDGSHASTNYGTAQEAYARHDDSSADERSAVFLQFELGEDFVPEDLQLAILAVPSQPRNNGSNQIHAHLYGLDTHDWIEEGLIWNNAPNLIKGAPLGREIRHSVVEGAGENAHILGQLLAAGYTLQTVDVTSYLRAQTSGKASFLIAQVPRWDVDIHVTSIPASHQSLTTGDLQPDGLAIRTREAATHVEDAAHLILIRRGEIVIDYNQWIQTFYSNPDPGTALVDEPFDYADGMLAGRSNWGRAPSTSDPSDRIVTQNGSVLLNWSLDPPLHHGVRYLWPSENQVTNQTLYADFDLKAQVAPQSTTGTQVAFMAFGNSDGSQQRGFVGLRQGTEPDTFQLGVSGNSNAVSEFSFSPQNLVLNTNYRILLAFNTATQHTALWIDNLDPEAPPHASKAGAGTNSGIRRLNLILNHNDGNGGVVNLGRLTIDNLQVSPTRPTPSVDDLIDPLANPSGDGIPNLLKFALGIDPRVPAGADAPRIASEAGGLALFHTRNVQAGGLIPTWLTSTDLAEWLPYTGPMQVTREGDIEQIRSLLTTSPDDPKQFFRMTVTEP